MDKTYLKKKKIELIPQFNAKVHPVRARLKSADKCFCLCVHHSFRHV